MGLSAAAKLRLVSALGYRKVLADEMEAAMFVPAPLSDALKNNLRIAMANKLAAEELVRALETGNQVLSAKTQRVFTVMMAESKYSMGEMLPLLSFGSGALQALLGSTVTYSAYAAQINNSGSTSLGGDVGVSPGGSIAGAPTIAGASNVGNAAAAQALADATTLYESLAARTGGTDLSGQDLGGMVLAPGIYSFSANAVLTGNLTLDAGGDANAIWIFQIAGDLTAAPSANVYMTNGATDDNVSWQVGDDVILGAASAFAGTLVVANDITLGAAAANQGRLLSLAGILTLDANTVDPAVTPPAPDTVVIPMFSVPAGGYGPTQNVTITSATPGATFYYTTNGATPTTASTLYSGPVAIAATSTLKVLAVKAGMVDSPVAAALYTINGAVATPTFSPVAGGYAPTQNVTISSATPGTTFYYTLNGDTPTTASTLYVGPIAVAVSLTIKALGVKAGFSDSAVGQAAYVITPAAGPSAVNLLTAGAFRILSEAGITNASSATVDGVMGVSPIADTAITGFALALDGGGTFSTSALVTGNVYAANYTAPTPATMTQAISDKNTAYADAAGRVTPDFTNLGSGNLGGLTLVPGLYKWTTGVTIPTDVTFDGGADAVWILQVSGTLDLSAATDILLANGALASNIFWQCTGAATIGTSATWNGILLSATSISVGATADVNGRLYAGTAVSLISGSVAG